MTEAKFHFPDPVWSEVSKDEEWVLRVPYSEYALTSYGDNSWHVALRGAMHGRMIDHQDGVHTLEDAKAYVYKLTCERIKDKYESAKSIIRQVEDLYLKKDVGSA